MNVKTGLVIAATAATLFLAGCATQADKDASTATPSVAQTSCAGTAKDRASCKGTNSCKGNNCKGRISKMKSVDTDGQM